MGRLELEKSRFSGIGKMFNLANSMGGDLVRFETGDIDFPTPKHIVDFAHDELKQGFTHYAPYQGYERLREAIVNKLRKFNNIEKKQEDLLITSGASGALFLAFQALLKRNDEVILADPSWPHFDEMIKFANGVARPTPFLSADGQRFLPEVLEDAITKRTKVILLNSPHNPTGFVFTKKDLQKIADIAEKSNITVISDEVYESFTYGLNTHYSIGAVYDKVVSVYSFSKTYAMCGWRLGYVASNRILSELMTKLSLYSVTCIPPFIQMAGLAALEGNQKSVKNMVKTYANRCYTLANNLNSIDGMSCKMPKGSIYVWPDVSKIGNSFQVAEELVRKSKCVTVPGEVFGRGGKGRLRLAVSLSSMQIREGLKRIRETEF
jgi:aminotransferase